MMNYNKVGIEAPIEDYSVDTYRALMNVFANAKVDLLRVRKKNKKKRSQYDKYPLLTDETLKQLDLLVVFSPYATSHRALYLSRKYNIPMLYLEQGFLPDSILCDAHGFWGDSELSKSCGQVLDQYQTDVNMQWSEQYCLYLIENNMSKRLQPSLSETSLKNEKDYVFLPMQYMQDQSVIKFCQCSYQKFMSKVSGFCAENGIKLLVKKHPHAYRKEIKAVDSILKTLKKRYGKWFHVVDGSIHHFCQQCKFVAGMNTGSIVDGLVNGSIISHCGQSIFMNSGAIVHDDKITVGLKKCMSICGDEDAFTQLRHRQLTMIYFLYNEYLLLEKDTHGSRLTNEDKIRKHLCIF